MNLYKLILRIRLKNNNKIIFDFKREDDRIIFNIISQVIETYVLSESLNHVLSDIEKLRYVLEDTFSIYDPETKNGLGTDHFEFSIVDVQLIKTNTLVTNL